MLGSLNCPAEAQSGDGITWALSSASGFWGAEGLVWASVEGNDLSVTQILQLPSAALAAIMLDFHSGGFYYLSRLKEKHVCLNGFPLEPRPPWWHYKGGHCAMAFFSLSTARSPAAFCLWEKSLWHSVLELDLLETGP